MHSCGTPGPGTDSNSNDTRAAANGASTSTVTRDTAAGEAELYKQRLEDTVQLMEQAWQRAEEAELRAEQAEAAAPAAAGDEFEPNGEPRASGAEHPNEARRQRGQRTAPGLGGGQGQVDPGNPWSGLDDIFEALPPELRMLRSLFEQMHHM